jgi:hypothetical protein
MEQSRQGSAGAGGCEDEVKVVPITILVVICPAVAWFPLLFRQRRAIMRHAIKVAIVSGTVGLFLTFTMAMFETPKAQATPTIAKGQPCGNCHTGSPPSKKNLKK